MPQPLGFDTHHALIAGEIVDSGGSFAYLEHALRAYMCFESLAPESTARSYGWVEIVGLDLDPPRPLSVRASLRSIKGSYTVLPNANLRKNRL